MDYKNHFLNLTLYNARSNSKIADLVSGLMLEDVDKKIVSSFPSLKETITHIWDAETIWLSRLQGISPKEWPSKDPYASRGEMCRLLITKSNEWVRFIETQDEMWFTTLCRYQAMSGNEYMHPIDGIMTHVFNHSTFHRGQIITMLRQLGVKSIPSTDFIEFVRDQYDPGFAY